jgi:molecular chaperone DnaK (HSP70)
LLIALRLILGCERIRKLLSQLPESSITVENMSDNGDVNFSLKREDMSVMCADLLEAFKALIRTALATAGITAGRFDLRS